MISSLSCGKVFSASARSSSAMKISKPLASKRYVSLKYSSHALNCASVPCGSMEKGISYCLNTFMRLWKSLLSFLNMRLQYASKVCCLCFSFGSGFMLPPPHACGKSLCFFPVLLLLRTGRRKWQTFSKKFSKSFRQSIKKPGCNFLSVGCVWWGVVVGKSLPALQNEGRFFGCTCH